MDFPILFSRNRKVICKLIRLMYYIIDFTLLCGELSAARICTGKVRSIMSIALSTRVDYQKTSRSDYLMMRMVMESLAVLRKDCGKGHTPSL